MIFIWYPSNLFVKYTVITTLVLWHSNIAPKFRHRNETTLRTTQVRFVLSWQNVSVFFVLVSHLAEWCRYVCSLLVKSAKFKLTTNIFDEFSWNQSKSYSTVWNSTIKTRSCSKNFVKSHLHTYVTSLRIKMLIWQKKYSFFRIHP